MLFGLVVISDRYPFDRNLAVTFVFSEIPDNRDGLLSVTGQDNLILFCYIAPPERYRFVFDDETFVKVILTGTKDKRTAFLQLFDVGVDCVNIVSRRNRYFLRRGILGLLSGRAAAWDEEGDRERQKNGE